MNYFPSINVFPLYAHEGIIEGLSINAYNYVAFAAFEDVTTLILW